MNQNCLFIRVDKKYVALKFNQLVYAASQRNALVLYCKDTTIITKMCISSLQQLLPAEKFCRIHRSFIVNLEEILWFDNQRVGTAKFTLPIGETYKNELMRKVVTIDRHSSGH